MTNFERWIEALRSGEYRQAYGQLREGERYCCLGVLCHIYHKDTNQGDFNESGHMFGFRERGYRHDADSSFLPSEVLEWLGRPIDQDRLVELNDTEKQNFFQIADYLETNDLA